ncbi:MAG: DNA-directed RNA polymerase subunit E'' [DPANN group archaeon]|nr:DNA-directed RNA polymerase subunit E'' [DPANN group archaeon]
MAKLACKICKKLVSGDKCPLHPDAKLSESWKGRIIVLDPEKSELAKKMKITDKGEYAIRL